MTENENTYPLIEIRALDGVNVQIQPGRRIVDGDHDGVLAEMDFSQKAVGAVRDLLAQTNGT